MSDWLHGLPLMWMAVAVFGFTYMAALAIYTVITVLAVGERGRSFKAVSPGMLPPLGIIFGLFVAFTAAQVWTDTERANTAVASEAGALRSVVVLATSFPGEPESRLRALIHDHIEEAAIREWPSMAWQTSTLSLSPRSLTEAMQLTLGLTPKTVGQQIAQREIATALGNAIEARRQRIISSRSQVNLLKWACLLLQAVCALIAVAIVHSDNRLACAITLTVFGTGVAAAVLLILAHDRPFTGELSVDPAPLLQVLSAIAQ